MLVFYKNRYKLLNLLYKREIGGIVELRKFVNHEISSTDSRNTVVYAARRNTGQELNEFVTEVNS